MGGYDAKQTFPVKKRIDDIKAYTVCGEQYQYEHNESGGEQTSLVHVNKQADTSNICIIWEKRHYDHNGHECIKDSETIWVATGTFDKECKAIHIHFPLCFKRSDDLIVVEWDLVGMSEEEHQMFHGYTIIAETSVPIQYTFIMETMNEMRTTSELFSYIGDFLRAHKEHTTLEECKKQIARYRHEESVEAKQMIDVIKQLALILLDDTRLMRIIPCYYDSDDEDDEIEEDFTDISSDA